MAEKQFDFDNVSDADLQKAVRLLNHVAREWLDLFNGINDTSFLNFTFMSKAVRVEKLFENHTDLPAKLIVRIVAEFYQKMCECAVYDRSVLENELQNRIEARRLN